MHKASQMVSTEQVCEDEDDVPMWKVTKVRAVYRLDGENTEIQWDDDFIPSCYLYPSVS